MKENNCILDPTNQKILLELQNIFRTLGPHCYHSDPSHSHTAHGSLQQPSNSLSAFSLTLLTVYFPHSKNVSYKNVNNFVTSLVKTLQGLPMCTRSKKPKSVQRPIKQAYKALHEVGLITSQIQSLLTHCPGATLASLLLFHSLGRLPPQRLSSCSTLIEDSCSRNPHDSFPHFFQFFLSYSLLKEVFPDNPI